jgi:hypothetical protein
MFHWLRSVLAALTVELMALAFVRLFWLKLTFPSLRRELSPFSAPLHFDLFAGSLKPTLDDPSWLQRSGAIVVVNLVHFMLSSCCAKGSQGLVPTLLSAHRRLAYNEGLALGEEDIAVSELALKTLGLQLFEVYRVYALGNIRFGSYKLGP